MARQTDSRRTIRARTQATQASPTFNVSGQVGLKTAGQDKFSSLSKALGLAGNLAAEGHQLHNDKAAADAERDVITGNLDEERGGAYRRAAASFEAEARWVLDRTEMEDELRSMNWTDMSREEVWGTIDKMFTDRYQGLDDRDVAGVVGPKMAAFREAKMAELAEEQVRGLMEQRGMETSIIARDMYLNNGAEGFDYQGLESRIPRDVLDNSQVNAVMLQTLSKLAIENGDPGLLENLPDRWENGTPTFKHSPAFAERILNSTVRAQSVADGRASAQAKAIKAERAAQETRVTNEVAQALLRNEDPTPTMLNPDNVEFVSSSLAGAATSAYRAARDDAAEQAADFNRQAALTTVMQTAPGTLTQTSMLTEYANGTFGKPGSEEAVAKFQAASEDLRQAQERRRQVLARPEASSAMSAFEKMAKASPSLLGSVGPEQREVYGRYRQQLELWLIANPEAPLTDILAKQEEVFNSWQLADTRAVDNSLNNPIGRSLPQVAAAINSASDEAVVRYLRGGVSNETITQLEAMGVDSKRLSQLIARSALTPQ